MEISTIGLDIAKSVFQVHGVNDIGEVVVRRVLRRSQMLGYFGGIRPCLVGLEACGSSHYWARELSKLGHEVRLMPPVYVKAYVKRGKTDAADAEAICEAVRRPNMRFVAVKSPAQQAILAVHRGRDMLVRQRTQLANNIRSQLGEFGVIVAPGIHRILHLMRRYLKGQLLEVPAVIAPVIKVLAEQLLAVVVGIRRLDKEIAAWHRRSEAAQRLSAIPGVGILTATALAATVSDPGQFKSGRQFAAWLGLTPRQHCSGGKERMGRISKQGDPYLRRLLITGMTARLRYARSKPGYDNAWMRGLLARKPARLVTVALANKTARIVWALMTRAESYRTPEEAVPSSAG